MPLRSELTSASVPLLDEVGVPGELGRACHVYIPGEHPLMVCPDKRELAMLMVLGDAPEALIPGYLRSQYLASSIEDIASVQVDQETKSTVVSTHAGITDLDEKTAHRTVITSCGQGTVFGSLMDETDTIHLPPDAYMTRTTLYRVVDATRLQQSIYEQAGSVHGCVLFDTHGQLLYFIEDVGCHNAVDVIAGRTWLGGMGGGDRIFYTAGRLTSEMVTEGAQMDTPFLLSCSDVMQMGYRIVQRVNLMLFTRCMGRHFLLYMGRDRFVVELGVAGMVGLRRKPPQAAESSRRSARVCPDKASASYRPPRGLPSQV